MKIKKSVSLFFCLALLFCFMTMPVSAGNSVTKEHSDTALCTVASNKYYLASLKQISVSKKEIKSIGAAKAIQEALTKAQKKGTQSKPYTVIVPAGTYYIDRALYIGSNTRLILKGVTLKRKANGRNMIRVGVAKKYNKVKGYYYKNITIEGGTLDGKNLSGTILAIGHAKNVNLKSMKIKNVKNSHIIEAGGVNGLTIQKCSFSNQTLEKKAKTLTYEAIQLDVLSKVHFGSYRSEDLTIKNVVINKCKFKNVPRGVGSHTGIMNHPMDGIAITDCTFENLKSAAVQGQNWINCTITGNTISNAPRGIFIYSMRERGLGTYLPKSLAAEGNVPSSTSNAYKVSKDGQNIVISGNDISLNNAEDPYSTYIKAGILVSGDKISQSRKQSDGSGGLPKGNYYISGVTVSGNKIITTGYGIRFHNARKVKVEKNNIKQGKVSGKNDYYGIQIMEGCKVKKVEDNVIANAKTNGIYVNKSSSVSVISNNIIKKPGKYGIGVDGSTVSNISGNSISNAGLIGICILHGAKVTGLDKNVIQKTKDYGININSGSSLTTMTENQVSDTGNYGIAIGASKVTTIAKNTVKKSTGTGIRVYSRGNVKKIMKNTIKNPGDYGICFGSSSQGKQVSGNKISGWKKKAVYVARDSKVEKIS